MSKVTLYSTYARVLTYESLRQHWKTLCNLVQFKDIEVLTYESLRQHWKTLCNLVQFKDMQGVQNKMVMGQRPLLLLRFFHRPTSGVPQYFFLRNTV